MKIDVSARARLRQVVKHAGSQKAAAKHLGVGAVYVGDLLRGRRVFSDRILRRLGLRRTVVEVGA